MNAHRANREEEASERAGASDKRNAVSPLLPDCPSSSHSAETSSPQLRAVSARLLAALEAEKTRIARLLHNDLAQKLTAMAIELALLESSLNEKEKKLPPQILQRKIGTLNQLTEGMIESVRRIESELRPKVLDEFGLAAALEWQSQAFQQDSGIHCEFSAVPQDIVLDSNVSTELFRLFQEILSNVSRHAGASRVEARLEEKAGRLRLEVRDNGRGITESQIASAKSLGLLTMRERSALIGGQLNIKGIPGKATVVTIEVPVKTK
jgi:signal transduction histidine kinase